ncbi:MAG: hypothetical protein AB1696_02915 [Planctomycetota bacterium]
MKRYVTGLKLLCLLALLQVAACEDATRTNFCKNGGFESGKGQWTGECAIDKDIKHSGQASVRFANKEESDESIISQTVVLNQTAAIPIVISGWSKAENATGRPNPNYSLWCDVEYVNDIRPGKVDDWHRATFDTGTHDWQYVESIFNPQHPIKQIGFHAVFRRTHAGTVWFDDLALKPLSDGPLAGTAADAPKAKGDDPTVAMLRERLPAAAPDEVLVSIQAVPPDNEEPRDTIRCFLGDEPMAELPKSGAKGVLWNFPIKYPPSLSRINPPAPFAWLRLVRTWDRRQLIVETAGKEGGRVAWSILLPKDTAVAGMTLEEWEAHSDVVSLRSLDDHLLLTLVTDVKGDADRCVVSLRSMTEERVAAAPRTAPKLRPLATKDGLNLGLGDDGGVWSVSLGDADVTSPDVKKRPFGLLVGDMFQGRFSQGKAAVKQDGDRTTVTTDYGDLSLRSTVAYDVRPNHVAVAGTVEDTTGSDRAVDLLLRLPVGGPGWTWWDELATQRAIAADGRYETDEFIFACLTDKEGRKGIGLALSPEIPCRFKLAFDPAESLLHVRCKYGLTANTKLKQKASFAFAIFRVDGQWAMRDAARRYYAMYPAAFKRRAMKEGAWLFAISPKNVPNLEDYGYYEGGAAMADFCLEKGCWTFPYIIPGQRSIQPLPEMPKDYGAAMRAFADFQEKPNDHWGGRLKRMIENCRPVQADGTHHIVIRDDFGADIKPKNPVNMVVFSVNCDPDLFADKPDEPTVARFEFEKVKKLTEENPKIKGIYVDSTCGWVARTMNFRRDHFAYTDYPLTYDGATGRPCIDGVVSMHEFLEELGRRLHAGDRYVFPNLGTWNKICWHYFVTDVVGLEGRTIEFPRLRYARTLAYQKPTLRLDYMILGTKETDLATHDGLELFFKRCAVYAIHPSVGRYCDKVYEKCSDLYKKYLPVIRTLGAAGWEPVTHATSGEGIVVERFGPKDGAVFFAVYNEGKEQTRAALVIDLSAIGLKRIASAKELLTDATLDPANITLALPPDGLGVIELKVE